MTTEVTKFTDHGFGIRIDRITHLAKRHQHRNVDINKQNQDLIKK